MEITKDKVTELFCIIDEFYKVFDAENAGKLFLSEDGVKRRRRKASLSDSEIMTILLYFHFGSFRNFKHYYLFFIRGTLKSYFPNAVMHARDWQTNGTALLKLSGTCVTMPSMQDKRRNVQTTSSRHWHRKSGPAMRMYLVCLTQRHYKQYK